LARCCLPAAALLAALGLCVCARTRAPLRRAGLAALPVLLCAMPQRELATNAHTRLAHLRGPVRVSGCVTDVVRAPLEARTLVTLQGELRLGFDGDLEVVPGDALTTLAFAAEAPAPGLSPRLRAVRATVAVTSGGWSFARGCALLRRALERRLLALVPGEHGAMLATLVLGRGTRPAPALSEAHRATGLSHLLAVSGAHAAMLASLLGMASRGRFLGARRARVWLVLALLTVYGCVAGAEPPVLRAVVAFTLAAVAARAGRPFGVATGLLAPALVTAAVAPDALTGPSFLLSYAAVTGLALALRSARDRGLWGWLVQAMRASFWATLLTTPLTLWFFGQVAPGTILLTPLCAPLVASMLLLGLVTSGAATALPGVGELLAAALAAPLGALASCYAAMVHAADALPATPVPASYTPPLWAIALLAGAGATLVALRPRRTSVLASTLTLSLAWFVPLGRASSSSLQLFAVGHGQAALVTTDDAAQVAVDCGSLHGGAAAARAVLDALTRRTLDLLVVTHDDQDHHNGVSYLAQRLALREAVLPAAMSSTPLCALLRARAGRVTLLSPGERINLSGLSIWAPPLPDEATDNDRSLWVRAHFGALEALLPGDAQEAGVAAALADGFASPADVLVLPHHGRPNCNAARLLQRVRPRACLASAAAPDGDTEVGALARRFGAEVWTTGRHGDLCFDGAAVRAKVAPPLLRRDADAR
jgi:competence protein ComEC